MDSPERCCGLGAHGGAREVTSKEDAQAGSPAAADLQMTQPWQAWGGCPDLFLMLTLPGLIIQGMFHQVQIAQNQTKNKSSPEEGAIRCGVWSTEMCISAFMTVINK